MLVLATLAAVIASQALISGVFSLTRQAVQLGFWPRVRSCTPRRKTEGQIYIPEMNWLAHGRLHRARARVRLELRPRRGVRHRGHRHDGDHVVPLLRRVPRSRWGCSTAAALAAPRAVPRRRPRVLRRERRSRSSTAAGSRSPSALLVFIVMTTWKRGREELATAVETGDARRRRCSSPTSKSSPPHRVRGTAVFMTSSPDGTPPCCCTTSSTTRCCTSRSCCSRSVTEHVPWCARAKALEVARPRPRLLPRRRARRLHADAERAGAARALRRSSASRRSR